MVNVFHEDYILIYKYTLPSKRPKEDVEDGDVVRGRFPTLSMSLPFSITTTYTDEENILFLSKI